MTALIEGSIAGDAVWLDQPYIRAAEAWASLTPREVEVAMLLAVGIPRSIAAHKLGCNPRTIDSHRTKVLNKLGVDNVVLLARWALRHGYVTLDDVG